MIAVALVVLCAGGELRVDGSQAVLDTQTFAPTRRSASGLVAYGNIVPPGVRITAAEGWQVLRLEGGPLWAAPASWRRVSVGHRLEAVAPDEAAALSLADRAQRVLPYVEAWTGPLESRLLLIQDDDADHLGRAFPGVAIVSAGTDPTVLAHELAHQVFGGVVRRAKDAPEWELEALCQEIAALTTNGAQREWTLTWKAFVDHGGRAGRADRLTFSSEPERVAHVYARAPWFYDRVRQRVGDEAFRMALSTAVKRYSKEPLCAGCLVQHLSQQLPEHAADIEAIFDEEILGHRADAPPAVELAPPPYALPTKPRRCGCDTAPFTLVPLLFFWRRRSG